MNIVHNKLTFTVVYLSMLFRE